MRAAGEHTNRSRGRTRRAALVLLARAFPGRVALLVGLTILTGALPAIFAAQQLRKAVGAVTVLVSHRFSTVRMADLIVVLEKGRVVEVGSHADLLARRGLYAELFGLQAQSYR